MELVGAIQVHSAYSVPWLCQEWSDSKSIHKDLQEELSEEMFFSLLYSFLKACNGCTETLKCAWMMSRYVSLSVLQNMQLASRHWKCSLV